MAYSERPTTVTTTTTTTRLEESRPPPPPRRRQHNVHHPRHHRRGGVIVSARRRLITPRTTTLLWMAATQRLATTATASAWFQQWIVLWSTARWISSFSSSSSSSSFFPTTTVAAAWNPTRTTRRTTSTTTSTTQRHYPTLRTGDPLSIGTVSSSSATTMSTSRHRFFSTTTTRPFASTTVTRATRSSHLSAAEEQRLITWMNGVEASSLWKAVAAIEDRLGPVTAEFFYTLIRAGPTQLLSSPELVLPPLETHQENNDEDSSIVTLGNKDPVVSPLEFLEHVIPLAYQQACRREGNHYSVSNDWWESLVIVAELHHNNDADNNDNLAMIWGGLLFPNAEALLARVRHDVLHAKHSEIRAVTLHWRNRAHQFQAPFTKRAVEIFMGTLSGNLQQLQTDLEDILPAANNDDRTTPNRIPSSLEWTRVYEDNTRTVTTGRWWPSNADNADDDRLETVLVTGECGSGKSCYAGAAARQHGYTPLYCRVDENSRAFGDKPTRESALLHEFVTLLLQIHSSSSATTTSTTTTSDVKTQRLLQLQGRLLPSTNAWAVGVLEDALHKTMTVGVDTTPRAAPGAVPNENTAAWLAGGWDPRDRPAKVAVILDGVNDIYLADGLLSRVTSRIAHLRRALARDKVILVIVGNGLAALAPVLKKRFHPSTYRLLVLQPPHVESLCQQQQQQQQFLSDRVQSQLQTNPWARIFSTNTRMLVRGVLPLLQEEYDCGNQSNDEEDDNDEKDGATLLVDRVRRSFFEESGLADIFPTDEARDKVCLRAFGYHFKVAALSAVRDDPVLRANLKRELLHVDHLLFYNTDDIFVRGFVATDGRTSPALRYLSCTTTNGAEHDLVHVGSQVPLQTLTTWHLTRYMKLRGFHTEHVVLQNALSDDFELPHPQKEKSKYCVVFSEKDADGVGEILALTVDGSDCRLMVVQCPDWKTFPNDLSAVCQAWGSLGIDVVSTPDGNFVVDWQPRTGVARSSFLKFYAFCQLLAHKLGCSVVLGDRILVLPVPTPTDSTTFPIPTAGPDAEARIWFRELLEPTISVVWGKEETRTPR